MSNTKVINYSAMRNSTTVNGGLLPKTSLFGDRILRQTTTTLTSQQQSTIKNSPVKLRMAASHKIPAIKLSEDAKVTVTQLTPRLSRRINENSISNNSNSLNGTGMAKNLSPLQSPQLIRSTRIDTNNWINMNKLKSSCGIHSKSPGSGTSVESIVPKYQQTLSACSNAANMAQKRSYNLNKATTTNKLTNRIVNTRNGAQISSVISTRNAINTAQTNLMNGNRKVAVQQTTSISQTATALTANKKVLKSTISTSSNTSSCSSSTKSFSAKFPNGLPFEDEFYHYRANGTAVTNQLRANNHHHHQNGHNNRSSIASDTSFSNNSSHSDESAHTENTVRSSYSYEDEFTRKPSNEPLYVDFTLKSMDKLKAATIANKKKSNIQPTAIATKTTYKLNTNDTCFCEFESIKSHGNNGGNNGVAYGKYNKLISNNNNNVICKQQQQQQQKPENKLHKVNGTSMKQDSVVYVAAASWVPKCNRLPHETPISNNINQILEPTNEIVKYVFLIINFISLQKPVLFYIFLSAFNFYYQTYKIHVTNSCQMV